MYDMRCLAENNLITFKQNPTLLLRMTYVLIGTNQAWRKSPKEFMDIF